MKLEDKIRSGAREGKLRPLPDALQGVTKERVTEVLRALDRTSRDQIDTVFALLDNLNPNWFFEAAEIGLKFCDGASTAHIACQLETDKVAALHISIGQPYFDQTIPVIGEQLNKAGYRLAALLNQIAW